MIQYRICSNHQHDYKTETIPFFKLSHLSSHICDDQWLLTHRMCSGVGRDRCKFRWGHSIWILVSKKSNRQHVTDHRSCLLNMLNYCCITPQSIYSVHTKWLIIRLQELSMTPQRKTGSLVLSLVENLSITLAKWWSDQSCVVHYFFWAQVSLNEIAPPFHGYQSSFQRTLTDILQISYEFLKQ